MSIRSLLVKLSNQKSAVGEHRSNRPNCTIILHMFLFENAAAVQQVELLGIYNDEHSIDIRFHH